MWHGMGCGLGSNAGLKTPNEVAGTGITPRWRIRLGPSDTGWSWLLPACGSSASGGEVDATRPASTLEALPDTHIARRLGHRAQETAQDELLFLRNFHHYR